MRRRLAALAGSALVAGMACTVALGAGGSREETAPPATPPSPEAQAAQHYNDGLGLRDNAWRLQEKLAQAPEDKRAKIEQQLRKTFENAAGEFEKALEFNPRHHQALSDLGYCRRQLGGYEAALEAYDAALALKPDYGPALEYRGEAYLGLNQIVEAQNAYRSLAEQEPKLAAELLGAMQSWIAARRAAPGAVAAAEIDGFEKWVADRGQAASTSSLHKSWSW